MPFVVRWEVGGSNVVVVMSLFHDYTTCKRTKKTVRNESKRLTIHKMKVIKARWEA